MKKHIVGLAIFTFIVGAAAIAYAIFNVPGTIPVSVVTQNDSPSKPTACWNMRRKASESNLVSPTVTQAVYDVKAKKLSWKLDSSDYSQTVLYLFIADENGIQKTNLAFNAQNARGAEQEMSYSYSPYKTDSKINLYLMADTDSRYLVSDESHRSIQFDASKAIPVTIDYGR